MHYYTNPAPERKKHFIFIENKMRNSFIKIKEIINILKLVERPRFELRIPSYQDGVITFLLSLNIFGGDDEDLNSVSKLYSKIISTSLVYCSIFDIFLTINKNIIYRTFLNLCRRYQGYFSATTHLLNNIILKTVEFFR